MMAWMEHVSYCNSGSVVREYVKAMRMITNREMHQNTRWISILEDDQHVQISTIRAME